MPGGIKYSLIKVKSKAQKKQVNTKGKIRVGVIVGPKNCDPILKGTQDPAYPEALKVKNNKDGWGGQYQVDTNLGLKLERAYPDLFSVDLIPGSQITPERLQQNHINFNLGYDMVNAFMSRDKKHEALVKKAFVSPKSNLWPEWDLQDWVYCKERYMQTCEKAGVPVAPTILISNGIKPVEVLKKVQAKGWDRFFVKPAHLCSFGLAGGKFVTKEVEANPKLLSDYQKEAKGYTHFLVQPYILKPNGNVFDEVRNWFIDGKWSYAIYTDGTDDNAVYPLKKGNKNLHMLKATKPLAEACYKAMLKSVSRWRGKTFAPPMTRIDVGVVPVGNSKTKVKCFINEVEHEAATWLVRYVPFDIVKRMVKVYPKKIHQLLNGLKPGERKPDAEALGKLDALVKRLVAEEQVGGKRKMSSSGRSSSSKKAKRA